MKVRKLKINQTGYGVVRMKAKTGTGANFRQYFQGV